MVRLEIDTPVALSNTAMRVYNDVHRSEFASLFRDDVLGTDTNNLFEVQISQPPRISKCRGIWVGDTGFGNNCLDVGLLQSHAGIVHDGLGKIVGSDNVGLGPELGQVSTGKDSIITKVVLFEKILVRCNEMEEVLS